MFLFGCLSLLTEVSGPLQVSASDLIVTAFCYEYTEKTKNIVILFNFILISFIVFNVTRDVFQDIFTMWLVG